MLVRELARLVDARVEGDAEREIDSAAPLSEAGPSQISFVGSAKAAAESTSSNAGCLLVLPDFALPASAALLRVANPRAAFAQCLAVLYPARVPEEGIHASAVIDPGATIGANVSIGPHATVGAGSAIAEGCILGAGVTIGNNVHLGAHCRLHARVTIYDGVRIGQRAVLHSGCVIGADGFGFALDNGRYRKFPQVGTVEIGDDVEIGANACIDRAALGVTRIGEGVKIDNLVHIAHNCEIGPHTVIAAQTGLSGGVTVGEYSVIGGQVGIGDKARIEARSVLGSGSGVLTSKIVRAGEVLWGTPARPLKQYLTQLAYLAKLPKLEAELRDLRKILNRDAL